MNFGIQTAESPRPFYILVAFGAVSFCVVYLIRWFLYGPSKPDPWDDQIASDLREGNCTPICHRCLNLHDPLVNFCPECGAPVGKYTNLLPYPYVFSVGDTLRLGASGRFKRSPLIVIGFMLVAWEIFPLIAPFYWVRLFKNMFNQSRADASVGNVNEIGSEEL